MTKVANAFWKRFEVGLLVLILAGHLYIAVKPLPILMAWFQSDDAFYYFKVAWNFTAGQGISFDGINPTNGFHPLWMVVCIPIFWLARFGNVLPLRILILVSAVISAGTAVLLFRYLREVLSRQIAALAALAWALAPTIHVPVVQNGLESNLSAFLIVALLALSGRWSKADITRWHTAGLGMVAGLAILARLDNIFLVLLVSVWFLLRRSSAYLRAVIPLDLAVVFISGLLTYYLQFGTGAPYFDQAPSMVWLVGLGFLIKPAAYLAANLYQQSGEKLSVEFLARCLGAAAVSSGILAVFIFLFTEMPASALARVVVIDLAITAAAVAGIRIFSYELYGAQAGSGENDQSPLSRAFWKRVLPDLPALYLPVVFLLGSYFLWSFLYTGSPLPVSGQIKRWWGSLETVTYGAPPTGERELLGLDESGAWSLALTPVWYINRGASQPFKPDELHILILGYTAILLAIVVPIFFLKRKWLAGAADSLALMPWMASLYAHIFSYTATSYIHLREWYWITEMLFTVTVAAVILKIVVEAGSRSFLGNKTGAVLAAILGAGIVLSFLVMLDRKFTDPPLEKAGELVAVDVLQDHTPPGSLIGMTGGGTTAYFLRERTIVNLDGLINSPDYFRRLRANTGVEFLQDLGLDYVYGTEIVLKYTDPYRKMFDDRLEPIFQSGEAILYEFISK